jgi:imidazoleglycerol-phosphate dehydratase
MRERAARRARRTAETCVEVVVDLDGSGVSAFLSGFAFLDHMVAQMSAWSLVDVSGTASGDLSVDAHHTVEDTAITFGEALAGSLGDRSGIRRFGWAEAPMDDSLATAAVDLGGRQWCGIDLGLSVPLLGTMPSSLVEHFIRSFAISSGMTLHLAVRSGGDDHHRTEAAFKALGLALRMAVEADPRRSGIPSTKGRVEWER